MTISVSGIAYDSDGSKPVVVTFGAGAVSDIAGNASGVTSFNVASNTTAPGVVDTVAPTVNIVPSLSANQPVLTLTFSEPVRALDASKFSYIKSSVGSTPSALNALPQSAFACANSNGDTVPCFWLFNTNAIDPAGLFAVKTMTINAGYSAKDNLHLSIAAGGFQDVAGNASASVTFTPDAVVVPSTGTWNGNTVTGAGAKTFSFWGSTRAVITLATGVNGGVATVTVDGVVYDSKETVKTVGVAKGVNLYAKSAGSTVITVPVTGTGWHYVTVTSVIAPSASNTTGLPSKRLTNTGPFSAKKKATFAKGTTVAINSVSGS